MPRRLYLENQIGERVGLNGETGIYFTNPAGLGLNNAGTFADLRKGFFTRISGDIEPQGNIVGDLVFLRNGDQYENYRNFVDWISQDYILYFVQKPYGTREFYRMVEVEYLTKTEKQSAQRLEIPASFICLTPWFLPSPFRTEIDSSDSPYKRYSYRYDYRYAAARQAGAVEVSATGHKPAAFSLEYTGALINPSILLKGASGTIYGQCDITHTLEATDKLIYSCEYGNSRVQKQDSDGTITDLIDDVDISKEVFGRIPLSEPCTISLTSSAAITANVIIKVYNYYRSV